MGGENWNDVMFDAMNGVGAWAALYFITLFLLGNFVVSSNIALSSFPTPNTLHSSHFALVLVTGAGQRTFPNLNHFRFLTIVKYVALIQRPYLRLLSRFPSHALNSPLQS